jgi:hypothetical protein
VLAAVKLLKKFRSMLRVNVKKFTVATALTYALQGFKEARLGREAIDKEPDFFGNKWARHSGRVQASQPIIHRCLCSPGFH